MVSPCGFQKKALCMSWHVDHGLAVSPHCPCGQVTPMRGQTVHLYTAAVVSGRLIGTLTLLASRDPTDCISSAALDLSGCSMVPIHVYIKSDDAATFWSLDHIMLHDSALRGHLQTSWLSPHLHRSLGNVLPHPLARPSASPPSVLPRLICHFQA